MLDDTKPREEAFEDAVDPERALEAFFNPSLGRLRVAQLQSWGEAFGDDTLSDGILSNPRLEQRILKQIIPDCRRDDIAGTANEGPLSLMLSDQRDHFVLMLGMAWHSASILEWVTWNQLGTKLPQVTLAQARQAVQAVDPQRRKAAGAKRKADPNLTATMIRQTGTDLLNAWASALPSEVSVRLDLFVKVSQVTPHPAKVGFVQDVAHTILPKTEGAPA